MLMEAQRIPFVQALRIACVTQSMLIEILCDTHLAHMGTDRKNKKHACHMNTDEAS